MWFLRIMLQRNQRKKLQKAAATSLLVYRIYKRTAIYSGNVMGRQKLEHLVKIGMIKGKCSWGKQLENVAKSMTLRH